MAYYQVKDIGKVGVVTDLSPTDIPPNAFTDAINARFVGNQITKFGGNKPISYNGAEDNIIAYAIQPMPFDYQYDHPFNILGTQDGLYLLEDQHWENISYWQPIASSEKKASATITSHPLMTGLGLSENQLTLKVGQSHDFYAEITPDHVKKQNLKWTLTPSGIGSIRIDPNDPKHMTFTAINTPISGVLSVSNTDGTLNDFCSINIIPNVDALSFDKTVYDIRRYNTSSTTKPPAANYTVSLRVQGTAQPANAYQWISSDTSVFSVVGNNTSATLTPGRVGSADLTCQLIANPSIRAKARVNVLPGVTGITVSPTSVILKGDDTTTHSVRVTVQPVWAPDQSFTLLKSRDEVATVPGQTPGVYSVTPGGYRDFTFKRASGVNTDGLTDIYQFIATDGGATGMVQFRIEHVNNPGGGPDEPDDGMAGEPVVDFDMPAQAPPVLQVTPRLAAVPTKTITSVTLDKTNIDFNQGDKETIKATVVTSNGNLDHLVYLWTISKDGIITHDMRNSNTFTVYGLGDGTTTVTCHVWVTEQKVFNVTPENNWYHTVIANSAVFNTNTFQPLVKEYGSKVFTTLPGWGEQTIVDDQGVWSVKDNDWICERVRAFNNRLFALNMTEPDEGGVLRHYPQRIRWSNFATENKAPTLWDDLADLRDPEDNSNSEGTLKALVNGYAGYIDLADTQGDLMDMLPLKDYLFVYTEFETYVGTPTMNAYQPMTFKKLFNDSGILAPNCAVEVEGNHFVVTQNDIIMHNGATKQSIANSIVKDHIISEISSVNPAATRVYLHSDKKEVWICYVPPGMPKNTWYNSKAAVWNYEFQTWTFYELPHTYEIVLSDPPTLDKSATWDDYNPTTSTDVNLKPAGKPPLAGLTWTTMEPRKDPWQKNFLNFRKRITIGSSAMKGLFKLDDGAYTWASDKIADPTLPRHEKPLRMWAERQGIDFDNLTEDWRQKHINNFHFQVNGSGTMQVEVGGTQYSNERGHQHNYRDYIAGRTRNLSVRLNHPYLYYGIIDEDPLSDLQVNGLVIDFALGGRR